MKIEQKKIFRGLSKILKNISWPINICLKYLMAPHKTFRPPSYILNVQSLSFILASEEATRSVLFKKVFFGILQNSQETPVPVSLF